MNYKDLVTQVTKDQNLLTELDWRKIAGGVALAGTLVSAQPSVSQAQVAQPSLSYQEKKIDVNKLLNAIKQIESSGGVDKKDRYEPGFERQLRKRFRQLSPNTRNGINKNGFSAMATSYGPYQVMAATAFDHGYTGDIESLRSEQVSRQVALKYLTRLINSSKTKRIEDVVSAYNAGLGGIGTNPRYVANVMSHYYR